MINSFSGEYSWLSNFYKADVVLDEITFPTIEHAFQYAKAATDEGKEWILTSSTPGIAKLRGRSVKLRDNWEDMKEKVMLYALIAKFEQNPELKQRLIDTGDEELVEGNTWGDKYNGTVDGVGQNKLGKLLMRARQRLNEER